MASDLFVDSGGWFSLLIQEDESHGRAKELMARAAEDGRLIVTTDYILDETATLLKARKKAHLAVLFFDYVRRSTACKVVPVWHSHFQAAEDFFVRHRDKPYSFTDCASFVVMKSLKLRDALSTDRHFDMAGFNALLH
jgi:predicted nucleic acid-binding protein